MDTSYTIRKATIDDVTFLTEVIISAEKSLTNTLGLAAFFEISEKQLKEYIISMLEQEIDGCEFSISSFFVACDMDKPIAALGGWIEGYFDGMPSSILKANLLGYTFPKENILKAQAKLAIIKDIQYDREVGAYQLEYSYVDNAHRGNRLTQQLMKVHLNHAKELNPSIIKAQLQPFENNEIIIQVHQRSGYQIVKRYVSNNPDILKYMPYNVKVLMEYNFRN
jgi:hypothetical protein